MKIIPEFRDDNDKIIVVGILILSMFFFFFPSLLSVLCLKNSMSENSYRIAKSVFNFELFLFLVSLIFMIPILGWLLSIVFCPILMIVNIIVLVVALTSIAKKTEVNIPTFYEFI